MTRQNTLVTCILTRTVLLSVLCLCWHFTFPVVVTYHRMDSPGCSQDGTSINGFWRCYLISFWITRQRCLVSELGVNPKMIGTHSIRKGAVTYMLSLPGGPSISSVCICAGWTMGTVKDVYMWYLSSGDQFVGHCLVTLPLLQMEFASSPPPPPPRLLFQHGMTGGGNLQCSAVPDV